MEYNDILNPHKSPWASVMMVIVFSLIGFVIIGPLIGILLAAPFIDGDILLLYKNLALPIARPAMKIPFFIVQGCSTLFGGVLGSVFYIKFFKKDHLPALGNKSSLRTLVILAGIIVILFMIPNSFFIEWNTELSLPHFLKGFESWAREKEDIAKKVTHFLITFTSFGDFLAALLIIAILPGIAEELLFRGVLQPELHRATGNIHTAIWISAMLFSLMHIQFFGLIPRCFLGVLFGYLHYWSKNIIVPMFAHFINNGFSLVMVYLYQMGLVEFDIESQVSAPWSLILPSSLIIVILMILLKNKAKKIPSYI